MQSAAVCSASAVRCQTRIQIKRSLARRGETGRVSQQRALLRLSTLPLFRQRMASVRNPYASSFRSYHKREAIEWHSSAALCTLASDAGDAAEAVSTARHILGANATAGIDPTNYMGSASRCCQAQLAKEKITFRDLDIIQHFLADNGCATAKRGAIPANAGSSFKHLRYILPRRTTMLSRKKQKAAMAYNGIGLPPTCVLICVNIRVHDRSRMDRLLSSSVLGC